MPTQILPTEITEKYPDVTRDEIFEIVELSTIKVIQQLHGQPVGAVVTEDGLQISLLNDNGFRSIDINSLKRKSKRRLLDEIELELMKRQACYEASYFSTIRGYAFTGLIERINESGTLTVQIQFNDVLKPIIVYGECPVRQQPPHEQNRYKVGDSMNFMVTSCLPVSNGRHAKARVMVSRVARELPSRILTNLTGLTGIRCNKRIPGGYSRIITRYQLPKDAINTVGKELRENLEVICPLHPGKPFQRRSH